MATQEIHPIRVVSRRTGLSPHVIRMWERRYGAVRPARGVTNRRLYSDADIDRLLLLRQAIQSGRSIGHVATLSTEHLAALAQEDAPRAVATMPRRDDGSRQMLETSLAAITSFDCERLETTLQRARLDLDQYAWIDRLVVPLMERVAALHRQGVIRTMQERLATEVVRGLLSRIEPVPPSSGPGPRLVVATPLGEQRDTGALAVAVTARTHGWRVTYLGASVPADEIAAAASACAAHAVALRIEFPGDTRGIAPELETLRRSLGDLPLWVGGRGCESHADALARIGVVPFRELQELRPQLERARAS